MRKLLYLTTLAMLTMLMFAPAALAQQGPACPAGQVNVLQQDGTYICVPAKVGDQTPEQIEAVTNDPRSNAETPIFENQAVPPETAPVVGADDGICVGDGEVDPDCAEALRQSLEGQDTEPLAPETPAATPTPTPALPDTGGAALLMPLLGVLLVAGGLVMRRR